MIDFVLKFREMRRMCGLTQKELAARSGVGEKSISSFETGNRIESMKLSQFGRLLKACGFTATEFFSGSFDRKVAGWDAEFPLQPSALIEDLALLPASKRRILVEKFRIMLDTALAIASSELVQADVQYGTTESDWRMLTSRN
jgi:DNA-binding XRE family transcriptional regulator